jgi:hypothetical protein
MYLNTLQFHIQGAPVLYSTIEQLRQQIKSKLGAKKVDYPTLIALHDNTKLCIYDLEHEKVVSSVEATNTFEIARQLANGRVFAAFSEGMFLFDLAAQTYTSILSEYSLFTCIELKNGTLLCETDSNISLLDKNLKFEPVITTNTPLISFLEITGGDLIISHSKLVGLYGQDLKHQKNVGEGTFYHFLEIRPRVVWGLKRDGIVEIDVDRGACRSIRDSGLAYYAILLSSGNIAVAFSTGNITIFDASGAEVMCIENATRSAYASVVIGEVAPSVILSLNEGSTHYWCARTGACLKKTYIGESISLLFLVK